ncbi:MAG TPA: DUF6159 family protein [Terriglobia bacterium]|nr:DUF6159 family protein [Terriglobia bacterium]
MGKISNSWELVKQSFAVLRQDEELMLLPVLSAISCVAVTLSLLAGSGLFYYPQIKAAIAQQAGWRPSNYLIAGAMFIFYLANYFVIVFFNTALVSAASIRLEGGDPTVRGGLRAAWSRLGVIFKWALLAATVGMVLRMIEERSSLIGRLVVGLLGLAWTLGTFLVVPVIAFENLGPIAALHRSVELFRKNWGEEAVGSFSFGLIFTLLAVPGILLPILGGSFAGGFGVILGSCLMVIYFIFLSILSASTHGIFLAALYRYATTGEVSPGFGPNRLSSAWQPKLRGRD